MYVYNDVYVYILYIYIYISHIYYIDIPISHVAKKLT